MMYRRRRRFGGLRDRLPLIRRSQTKSSAARSRPDPQPIPETVADADKATNVLLESPYIMMYPTRRNFDGSEFYSLAGRITGGGSSVNMMSIPRPIKADLDTWAAQGNPEWSWEKVLPVLKRMESDQDFPNRSDSRQLGTDLRQAQTYF